MCLGYRHLESTNNKIYLSSQLTAQTEKQKEYVGFPSNQCVNLKPIRE